MDAVDDLKDAVCHFVNSLNIGKVVGMGPMLPKERAPTTKKRKDDGTTILPGGAWSVMTAVSNKVDGITPTS